MDSKAKRTAVLIVLCAMTLAMAAVAAVNFKSFVGGGKNKDSASNVPQRKIEEDGKVSGADLSAFLRDEEFFDSDMPDNDASNQKKTDENGNPIKTLTLLASSVERDIRVKIVDENGDAVIGHEFTVVVEDTGAYADDDKNGVIRISDIKPGEYSVSLNDEQGFDVPKEPVKVRVKSIVSYTVIDDIKFFVHSEDEIDVEKDDTQDEGIDSMDEDDTQYKTLHDVKDERETAVQLGIDVSKWNNITDWEVVKAEGVDFVIIRCGYRGSSSGWLVEDPDFFKNLEGAKAAGIKVGVYFFTQAVDIVEAVEEASMVVSLLGDKKLEYPVFIDTEGAGGNGRADGLDAATRTAVVNAFCRTIENAGLTSGVYASRYWYLNNLNMEDMEDWKIWLAEYRDTPGYEGKHDMWQYTSSGTVAGIEGRVDLNVSYLGID